MNVVTGTRALRMPAETTVWVLMTNSAAPSGGCDWEVSARDQPCSCWGSGSGGGWWVVGR